MALVIKRAEESNYVLFVLRICVVDFAQEFHFFLACLAHKVVPANHLDSDQLVRVITAGRRIMRLGDVCEDTAS